MWSFCNAKASYSYSAKKFSTVNFVSTVRLAHPGLGAPEAQWVKRRPIDLVVVSSNPA